MTFNYALSSLLLPPTSLIALTLLGVLMLKRRRIAGLVLIVGSQLLLLALSTPVVANAIVRTLEPPPAAIDEVKRAQAIVVLGGGRNLGSPEWGGETVNDYTLRRARYGARLARETGLPLYVSGGKPDGGESAEGTLMRGLLASELGVPVKWVETASETTREQAQMVGAGSAAAADQPHRAGHGRRAYAACETRIRAGWTDGDSGSDRLHRAAAIRAVPTDSGARRTAPIAYRTARVGVATPPSCPRSC